MKLRIGIISAFFVALVFAGYSANAGEDARLYSRAIKSARAGDIDFAYMRYHEILRDFSGSKFRKQALLACGEYYFRQNDYKAASATFGKFIRLYPEDPSKLFVLAYLYRIANENEDEVRAEELKKEIISFKQLSLVFKKYEHYDYTSPLNQRYRAVFEIDKIQFLVQGDLLAEVYL